MQQKKSIFRWVCYLNVKQIFFSDEANFYLHGHINKQNYRFWTHENSHITEIKEWKPKHITVPCLLHRFLGPFLLRKTLRETFIKLCWNPNFFLGVKKIFISLRVWKCGLTHASRAEILIFTPRDIKFRTILVRKTFSWQVWLHPSPSARAANSHSLENVSSHS